MQNTLVPYFSLPYSYTAPGPIDMRSCYKYLLPFLLQVAFFNSLNAQSIITGKVTNPDGKPLIGANITARQALSAAITSHDGMFKIVAGPTATLLISYVGYARVMFAIGGQREISIVMVPSRELLQQVVVIGYGIQKKEDITGAISSVDASDFNGGIVNSPEQLFRGKVAGVELTQNDGEPGAAFTVRIRGNSTIRAGNDPLYIVDGYPVDNQQPAAVGRWPQSSV